MSITSNKTYAKRRFGQNFLVDRNVIDRIILSVNPQSHDTILEIGPGRGALTTQLAEKAARVIAIELDRELVPQLRAQFADKSTVEVIETDALTVELSELIQPNEAVRVVANLPYNIGTAILQRLIEQRHC